MRDLQLLSHFSTYLDTLYIKLKLSIRAIYSHKQYYRFNNDIVCKSRLKLKIGFLYFYFFNTDFSFTVHNIHLTLYGYVQNVLVEGSVSQNFDLGPSLIFMI